VVCTTLLQTTPWTCCKIWWLNDTALHVVPFLGMYPWCELGATCALNAVFSVGQICVALGSTNWFVVQECMH